MPIGGELLLSTVDRTLGAVYIQDLTPREGAGGPVLHRGCVEARQLMIAAILREDFRVEPVEGGRQRDAHLPPLPRGRHVNRRVLGQALRVVGVRVFGRAAIDGLAKEIWQGADTCVPCEDRAGAA